MFNNEDRPQGYNIGNEIIGDKYVSTAAVSASCAAMGYYIQFETIIWEWNGTRRTLIHHQVIHNNGKQAGKVHGYIVGNMKKSYQEV